MTEDRQSGDAFSRQSLRRALKHWRSGLELGKHPLSQLDIVAVERRAAGYADAVLGRGAALRRVLHSAIEQLRPNEGEPDFLHRGWRPYLILTQQYIKGRATDSVAGQLGVSKRTYFEEQNKALDRLADLLLREEQARRGAGLAARSSAILPPAPQRPPQVEQFVGRRQELIDLTARLSRERFVIVAGMAGVGKTALAAVLARQAAPEENIFWHVCHEGEGVESIVWQLAVFLANHGQEGLWRLLESARLSNRETPPFPVLFDYLFQMLSGQGYLLGLDDFHHIDDDPQMDRLVEGLGELLRAGKLALIIASRRIPPFVEAANREPLAGLSLSDCQELLARNELALSGALVADLHRLTEGNAQLLVLAIDLLRHSGNAARLVARLARTEDIERFLMIEIDEGLTEAERAVMEAVALLLGYPGSRDAIEAIVADGEVGRALISLTGRYLLSVSSNEEGRRQYSQHAMVQAFYYHLLGRQRRRTMHERAGAFYAGQEPDALKAARHLLRAEMYRQAAWLVTAGFWRIVNRGQVRELRYLLERFTDRQMGVMQWVAVNITRGQIYGFVEERELAWSSYREALSRLAALPGSPPVRTLRAKACRGMGTLLIPESLEEAEAWLHRGLQELGGASALEEAALRIRLGHAAIELGKFDAARRELEQGMALLPADLNVAPHEAEQSAAVLADNLGPALQELEAVMFELPAEFGVAPQALSRGLALLPESPARLWAIGLLNLGIVDCVQGRVAQGKDCYLRALAISEQLLDYWRVVDIRMNLGIEIDIAGRWEEAIVEYRQGLALARKLGSEQKQAMLDLALGIVNTKRGDDDAAEQHLERCVAVARTRNWRIYLVAGLSSLAHLRLRQDNAEAALALLAEAEALAEEIKARDQLAEILFRLAEADLAAGQVEMALGHAQQAVDLARELDTDIEEGTALRILGQAYLADGQHGRAVALLEESLAVLQDRDPYKAARTQVGLGQALLAAGKRAPGVAQLVEARATFQRLGAQRDLAKVDGLLDGYDDTE